MEKFQAGFAKIEITPPLGSLMSGFVIRTEGATAVHDPLFARALALSDGKQTALLLILDVIGVSSQLVASLRQQITGQTAIPCDQIAILATHTHGGPVMLEDALLGSVDASYLEFLSAKTTSVATEAVAALHPVSIFAGLGQEITVAHNRRVEGGPIDPDVPVLRFENEAGLYALFASYACHPVMLGPNNLQFTRDYPGYFVDTLEELYPQTHILFATGCCGQINTPGHSAQDSIKGLGFELRTFAEAKRLGRLLASAALHTSETLANPRQQSELAFSPLKLKRKLATLPLKPAEPPSQEEIAAKEQELESLESHQTSQRAVLESYLNWAKTQDWQQTEVMSEVMCIMLGKLCLALYPGEVFVEHGLELKARFPDLILITLAYANAAPGYIPHHSAYRQGGYEVEEAFRYYGYPAVYCEDAGDKLVNALTELIQSAKEA